ncbi:MAG: hypothetical protein ACJAXA_003271 [Candidatus Aldehydirespiratoraceae bacterium]
MGVPNLECAHEEVEGSVKEEQIRRGELDAADRSAVVEPHATSRVRTALTSSLAKDMALVISSVAPGESTNGGGSRVQRGLDVASRELISRESPGRSKIIRRVGPTAEEAQSKENATGRWGKLRGVVDKSRSFNEGTTPTTRPEDSEETTTAGGAWLASQVGSKEKIGSVDEYMGSKDDAESQQSKHLEQFLAGAHAFISVRAHKNIFNLNEGGTGWGAWGSDANFVAPLASADGLLAQAAAPGARGLWDLEVALGVAPGDWVRDCAPSYSIFRYIVHDPAALNLRIPSGNENQAYSSWWKGEEYQAGRWEPKGKTEGGASEAVIDNISLAKLETLGKDVLEIVEDTSLAANTQRVVDENAGS